ATRIALRFNPTVVQLKPCDTHAQPPHVEKFQSYSKQIPQSSRRNLLPVKRINGSLLMVHEHVARALIELMQSRKTSSGTDHVLHHAPRAFDGVEVVPTMGR